MNTFRPFHASPPVGVPLIAALVLLCGGCDVFMPNQTGKPFSTGGGTASVSLATTGTTSEATPDVVFSDSAVWDTGNGANPVVTATPTPVDTSGPMPIYTPTTMAYRGPVALVASAPNPRPESRAEGPALRDWTIDAVPGTYSVKLHAAADTGLSLAIWMPGAAAPWAGTRFAGLAAGDHVLTLQWAADGSVIPSLDGHPGARQLPRGPAASPDGTALLRLDPLPGESAEGIDVEH